MGGVWTSSALAGRLALFVALAGCCVNGWSFARRLLDPPVQPHVSSWREVASGVRARRPALLCRDAANPAPVERTRLIALDWELAPVCVRAWDGEDGDPLPDAVFTSAWSGEAERDRLAALGFSPVAGNGFAAVWRREPGDGAVGAVRTGPGAPSALREGCGVGAVLLAVAVLVWWTVRGTRGPVAGAVAVGLALFALYACAALSHRLPAPNGLGVYGGKAKLLLASGGVPDGFWTDPAYGVYQPSYPPGLALLALAADAVAGGCGDWLVQLLPVGAMAALAVVLLSGTGTWTGRLLILAVLLSPVSVRLAAEFHAEPFAALCLVAGGAAAGPWRTGGMVGGGMRGALPLRGGPLGRAALDGVVSRFRAVAGCRGRACRVSAPLRRLVDGLPLRGRACARLELPGRSVPGERLACGRALPVRARGVVPGIRVRGVGACAFRAPLRPPSGNARWRMGPAVRTGRPVRALGVLRGAGPRLGPGHDGPPPGLARGRPVRRVLRQRRDAILP